MAATHDVEVTAILALSDVVPRIGEEYLVATAEFQSVGTLNAVALQPPHSSLRSGDNDAPSNPPSRLASIRLTMPRAVIGDLMPGGKARPIAISCATGGLPIAAGLAIGGIDAGPNGSSRTSLADRGLTIWMTGLSGAGKTTIANQLEQLLKPNSRVETLDADIVRTHICKGLGFTEEDRRENVWRLALTASMLAETGAVVLVSAISPYRTARDEARKRIGRFIEVFVNAPLFVCEGRDVKGLYKRARNGEIQRFTGIDDPYEPPLDPDVECRTDVESISESVAKIIATITREKELWLESTKSSSQSASAHDY
jgi:adenylylsulfate kinase